MNADKKQYLRTVDEVIQQLQTNLEQGLSAGEVKKRLHRFGYNELPTGKRDSWGTIFLSQFQSPLIYILLLAAVIIFMVGESKMDAFIIAGVLLFNAIVGTIQEGRTKNIIESLRRFIKTESVVIRDGEKEVVEDRFLVPGDIILLQEGQRVPADARIIAATNLMVDESALTGESSTVRKDSEPLPNERLLADRENMVYRGTYIMGGHGKAVVVSTGKETEIGSIQKAIEEIKTDIPLRVELERLSYFILLLVLAVCTLLFFVGFLEGRPVRELLVMLTALFICVVPEGLPVVLTLVLVNGAYTMAQKNVLVKNLQAVDALGRCDVIVIDKTGTLTRNEMLVSSVCADEKKYEVTGEGYFTEGIVTIDGKQVALDSDSSLKQMGIAATLLNNAEISYVDRSKLFEIKGDPTEAALFVFAQKLGLKQENLKHEYELVYEIPFDSAFKFHAAFFKYKDDGVFLYVIGSPEILFSKASDGAHLYQAELETMLAQGLRVVACGMRKIPSSAMDLQCRDNGEKCLEYYQNEIKNLTILGLFGIQDSIRSEVAEVIDQARESGIRIVMATGDHKSTALYVAKKVGLYTDGDLVVDGSEFHTMTDEQLLADLDKTTVYSRVSPTDKLRIIKLFHKKKNIVAMTGDGINDAPSLVAADLGIAMGGIGTEVAKQAADIVLLDDSFASIMKGVEQGRHIFYALRRVILYFFTTNMGEVLIVLFAMLTPYPLPLTAPQILWLNLVTDGFLDVSLAAEPKENGLLNKKWLQKKFRLIDLNSFLKTMFSAIPMAIGSLAIFMWDLSYDGIERARTMVLITMAMFQWFNAWNCRSERLSILQSGLLSNKWLVAATTLVFMLQLLLVYAPFMQYIFKTTPLSFNDWILIFGVTFPIVILEETRKFVVRRFF